MELLMGFYSRNGYFILSTYAETAFDERMKIYTQLNIPIKNIKGTKVIFDESIGANTSEQFSKEELEEFGRNAGLVMIDCQKVGVIGYICKFEKK